MISNRPRAFRLPVVEKEPVGSPEGKALSDAVTISPDTSLDASLAGDEGATLAPPLAPAPRRRRIGFGTLLALALSGLAAIGISTAIERAITSLFDQSAWLGGLASALAGLAALALLGLLGRETVSILRQRRITALRQEAARLATAAMSPAPRRSSPILPRFMPVAPARRGRGRFSPGSSATCSILPTVSPSPSASSFFRSTSRRAAWSPPRRSASRS